MLLAMRAGSRTGLDFWVMEFSAVPAVQPLFPRRDDGRASARNGPTTVLSARGGATSGFTIGKAAAMAAFAVLREKIKAQPFARMNARH